MAATYKETATQLIREYAHKQRDRFKSSGKKPELINSYNSTFPIALGLRLIGDIQEATYFEPECASDKVVYRMDSDRNHPLSAGIAYLLKGQKSKAEEIRALQRKVLYDPAVEVNKQERGASLAVFTSPHGIRRGQTVADLFPSGVPLVANCPARYHPRETLMGINLNEIVGKSESTLHLMNAFMHHFFNEELGFFYLYGTNTLAGAFTNSYSALRILRMVGHKNSKQLYERTLIALESKGREYEEELDFRLETPALEVLCHDEFGNTSTAENARQRLVKRIEKWQRKFENLDSKEIIEQDHSSVYGSWYPQLTSAAIALHGLHDLPRENPLRWFIP